MKSFIAMYSAADEQKGTVLTLWKKKQDMDAFYSPGNRIIASFLEKAKPLMQSPPERSDYVVAIME